MRRNPEIIEAVPQSSVNEYRNRMRLMWGTAACMAVNSGAFLVGFFTRSSGTAELLLLLEASLTLGMASTYLNYIRKEAFIHRMDSLGLKTTYSAIDSNESVQPRGRKRLLRLMSPGLKAGILAQRFHKPSSKN